MKTTSKILVLLGIYIAIFLTGFFIWVFTGCSGEASPEVSRIHILSTREYSVAVPAHHEGQVPKQYVVRYVLSGELREIPTYSEDERDQLIEWLGRQ